MPSNCVVGKFQRGHIGRITRLNHANRVIRPILDFSELIELSFCIAPEEGSIAQSNVKIIHTNYPVDMGEDISW